MPKIIHVIPNYYPKFGGSVKTVSDFLESFPDSEAISFDNDILKQRLPWDNRVHHLKSGDFPWNKNTYFLSKKTKQKAENIAQNADIIFCHQLFRAHNNWVQSFCQKTNKPYVVVPHGAMDPWVFTYRAFRKKAWFKLFGLNFLQKAACILTATRLEAEKLRLSHDGFKNVVTNYWPTKFPQISERKFHHKKLRQRLKIPEETRLLLFIGRLDPCKNLVQLIEYFSQSKVTKTHLLIVGMDFYYSKKDIMQMIKKTGSTKIHLLEAVFGKEKDNLYAAVDAYISLSFKENFSYTAAESLASGLPVLLSPGNDLTGDLNSNVGWLMKKMDKKSVCKAIEDFDKSSDETIKAMGTKATKWSHDNLNMTGFKKRTEKLIQNCL